MEWQEKATDPRRKGHRKVLISITLWDEEGGGMHSSLDPNNSISGEENVHKLISLRFGFILNLLDSNSQDIVGLLAWRF